MPPRGVGVVKRGAWQNGGAPVVKRGRGGTGGRFKVVFLVFGLFTKIEEHTRVIPFKPE